MPTLDPTEAFEHLKTSTTGEISKIFPLVGKKNKITLNKIWVDDNQHIDDLRSQAETKMKGGTWAVPIKADLTLANHDGTVVDRKTLTLAHMPKYTRRYSFIVGGNEYQVDHQFRLKSGIYPRIQANGEISAQFNAMRGASTPEGPDNWDRTLFNVGFHPEKRKMTLTYRDTNVPLYSVVKALGGTDENMKRAWGHEVFHSNVSLEPTKDLRKLYKAITRKSGDGVPEEELAAAARTAFHDMAVDPNVVEKTVGHRTERIDHNSLTMAGNRLIGISKGTHPPADRDSLEFKDLLSVGDLMAERVRHSAKEIRRKAANNLDRQTNLGQIIVPQMFRKPIGGYFTSNGTMASTVEQLNPLEMLSGHLKTTVMGKGGISSEHQIEDQMRAINPSSLGFLDPLHTPEGARTGITLHLPIGVEKEGNTLKQRALDVATGQPTFITPRDLMRNVVSFADQYHTKDGKFLMKGGKPIPRSETVKASDSGEFGQTHHSKVKYILPQSRALFDPASNLLPFLPTAQGARATMAAKQMEQAVSLKHREEPLVQTVAGQSGDNKVSFEKLLGQFASHVSPVSGKVVRVQPGAVHVQDAEGKLHEVQTYDHYPLNDNQAFLHSTPVVKAGDTVQKGQLVADTNFSKNGHLTLGTNIRTAYIPYKGLNFEDGVVISESAAKKLTSEHLHRVEFQRDDTHTLDRDKFRAYHPDVISGEHAKNLDDDGVVKVGTKVNPGDVLIAALKEHNLTSEDKILRSLNKTLASPYKDASERWHKDYPGVGTRVVQDGKNVKIHIKTEEPAQIGDKIVGRHANKGIITTILPDHEMPHTSDGQPLHVLMNPAGVPSRINPGQLLETAASKIAQKTGKPYFVDNFKSADHDYSKEVKDDLAQHGISDTEDVYDPKTKQLLGKGFVGSQYILKLKHQVTKKTSVRSGGVEMPYDSDFAPRKGPPNSAQAMDPLSLYAMLSHGARHNLREIATWKAGGADRKYNQEFWAALQAGASLPTPKPTFAYDKFHNMIRGLGVNVEKQGNSLHLVPFTDKQVRNMSSWEVKDPSKMVIAKNMKPESDGLFSEHLGGPEGTKWGHITLNERMPNPIFEGPIQDLLGIKTKDDYERIINGEVPIEGKRGGAAIAHALSKLDTDKELEDARARLAKATKSNRDKLNRKVKYLQALKESGLTAHDAYTQQVIPVLPPIMRPYSRRPSGELLYADVNELYKHIGQDNQQMKKFDPRLPDEEKNELRAHLYDNLRSLAGLGGALNTRERRGYRGIIQQISGKKAGEGDGSPKEGYFQRKIMKRQQDLSMRSTIVPEPSLGLDQVVLPRNLAMELYKPFVVRQLRGMGLSTPAALREVKDKGEMAHRALEHVVDERPILMKRDPVLHKYGVQAFKPVLGEGKAIKIHPLVTGGYNADFDGDCILGEVIVVSLESDLGYRSPDGEQEVAMPHTGKIAVHKVLDIKNFPRIEESRVIKRSGVIEYDVPGDTYVPAYNGGKMEILPVTKYSIHPNCEEWRVLSRANREIICSSDHSLALLDPETLQVVKTAPRDSVGKCFPVMRSLEDPNLWGALPGAVSGRGSHKMPSLVDLTEEIGWLVGTSTGDGWVSNKGFNSKDLHLAYGRGGDEVQEEWVRLVRTLVPDAVINVRETPHEFDGYQCVSSKTTVSSSALGVWLEELMGKGAHFKHLPQRFLEFPEAFRRGLFCGLIDTDGTVNWSTGDMTKKPQFSLTFSTVSRDLADGIQLLGLSLGLHSSRTEYQHNDQPAWIICFSTNPIQSASWISLKHKVKATALESLRSSETVDPGRNDFVPLPEWVRVELLQILRDLGATLRPPRRNKQAFSQYVVLRRQSPILTRESVLVLRALCSGRVLSQWLERWFILALDTSIGWDLVESAEPTGEIKEMYDITVPDAWTFTMANGAVVWDTMSGYVPISQEAVQEARKMMPSENLFSPANGKVMYTPKQDMVLGLHRLSEWGKDSGKSFQTGKEALQAFKSKKIGETDVVDIGGMKTTVGRLIMAHSLSKVQGLGPEHHGDHLKIAAPNITTKILSDPNWRADKNTIAEILTHVGKADPGSYSHVANRLKDLGDDNVYRHLFSYNLGDLQTAKHLRDPLIQEGRSKEKAILSSGAPKAEKHQKVVELWSGINSRMNPIFQRHADDTGNTFRAMERSGARGNWNQIKQILAAPLVVTNSEGKPLPYAITKNFAEGLDTSDYWVSLHGARRGAVMRSKETEDPGFLSKQMMQSTIGNTVTAHDCGTTEGISMSADNPEIHDRYLAKPLKVGEHTHQAGTLITPNFTQEMRKHGVDKAVVRTPLHCEHTKGICARCYGLDQDGKLPALGTNLGAIATQSLGEPLTQGAMQVFHIGAVATTGPKVTDDFTRLNQLVSLPATLKDQATLSTAHGKVEKVEEDPAVGGWHVTVDGKSHYVPQHLGLAVKRGDEVKKGSQLSHGLTNPHELLELNGINAVKQHITDEISRLYKGKASRKNVEVVVRSLTDLSEVDHPGDSDHFLRGDRASTSAIMAENRRLQKEGREPIKHTPFLAGIGQIPLKGSDDWVARLNHSRLKDTVLEAAAKGWHSPIHGHNPLGPYALGSEFGLSRPGHEGEY